MRYPMTQCKLLVLLLKPRCPHLSRVMFKIYPKMGFGVKFRQNQRHAITYLKN